MKKGFRFLLFIIAAFLVVSFFIPSVQQKEITVNNTLPNVILSVYQPKDWVKWDGAAKAVWQKDSSSLSFAEDNTKRSRTIIFPDKKITITPINNLSYTVEETKGGSTDYFIISMLPHVDKNKAEVNQSAKVVYAWNSNLFHKIFPFFNGGSFCEKTVSGLISYLNDDIKFYGFPIKIATASDTLFITRKEAIPKSALFKILPAMFDSLDYFCKQNNLSTHNRNVYYEPLHGDSLQILAGINIDTAYIVEGVNQFMQMPAGQPVVVADFEGLFVDRPKVYEAMRKYMLDKELMKGSVCFEKYLSAIPRSDTSVIKMKLVFPIRGGN